MHQIPVVDLFAGPGGLSEGFHACTDHNAAFAIALSIEKERAAHRTLLLRSFFRAFPRGEAPEEYYRYVKGKGGSLDALFASWPVQAARARRTAVCLELGASEEAVAETDRLISEAVSGAGHWVLLGGPPCQAYSLAGRARHAKKRREQFEADQRHILYREYLRILGRFRPSIFVMENVKGLLTARHGGRSMFSRIWEDLAGENYAIHSFVTCQRPLAPDPRLIKATDFLIEADRYGIPQCRDRIILLGIRGDLGIRLGQGLEPERAPTVKDVIDDLPPLRAVLSREPDSPEAWQHHIIEGIPEKVRAAHWNGRLQNAIESACAALDVSLPIGGRFVEGSPSPASLRDWYVDAKLGGFLNHEARAHMASDFARYLFVACFGAAFGRSPSLQDFPLELLPKHRNAADAARRKSGNFADRFKVHVAGQPAATIVSHIAKDGHYYIHYDPAQCRSMTVREAARLQTFPDNYFFEGNRTEQYTQVGNAVPPLLAYKIAGIVADLIRSHHAKGREPALAS